MSGRIWVQRPDHKGEKRKAGETACALLSCRSGKAKRWAYHPRFSWKLLERAGKLRNVVLSGKTEGYVKSWGCPFVIRVIAPYKYVRV